MGVRGQLPTKLEASFQRAFQRLSNDHLLASIGFVTAENEPRKVWIAVLTFHPTVFAEFAARGTAPKAGGGGSRPGTSVPMGLGEELENKTEVSTLVERFHIEPFSDFSAK